MITPVILCGGSGTRLWPLSRKSFPKQFTRLVGESSLFQTTVERLRGEEFNPPLIVTGSDYRFIATEQLESVGVDDGTILIEPDGRNTAPAVLAAALHIIARNDHEGIMLVAPSDHVIADPKAFVVAIKSGLREVEKGNLVTFGIQPDRAETGYGYLEMPSDDLERVQPLKGFIEKPNLATAEKMFAAGTYLWNAGIFLFSVKSIIDAFEKHAPSLMTPIKDAVDQSEPDLSFIRLAPEPWMTAESISIDYAIMEKADNLSVVPFSGKWSDLGDWNAIWRESEKDAHGNVTAGETTAIDCENSLLRSESDDVELVGIGVKDTIVVATRDALLVADKSRAQDLKIAVDKLKQKEASQAENFPHDHRPWGWFETLAISDGFQVKRIVVKPGAALSLQSHKHRAEHWVVVSGTAKVTIDDKVKLVSENEFVYVPLGAIHRLQNPGKVPMILIEVQTGSYLGEDDIVRHHDIYSRGQGAKG